MRFDTPCENITRLHRLFPTSETQFAMTLPFLILLNRRRSRLICLINRVCLRMPRHVLRVFWGNRMEMLAQVILALLFLIVRFEMLYTLIVKPPRRTEPSIQDRLLFLCWINPYPLGSRHGIFGVHTFYKRTRGGWQGGLG